MGYEEALKRVTLLAEADNTSDQYKFVKKGAAARGFLLCDTEGEAALGVLQNTPTNDGTGEPAGEVASLDAGGVSKVVTGGAVSVGDNVITDANGRAVTASSGDIILGVAQEAASASGILIPVLLSGAGTAEA